MLKPKGGRNRRQDGGPLPPPVGMMPCPDLLSHSQSHSGLSVRGGASDHERSNPDPTCHWLIAWTPVSSSKRKDRHQDSHLWAGGAVRRVLTWGGARHRAGEWRTPGPLVLTQLYCLLLIGKGRLRKDLQFLEKPHGATLEQLRHGLLAH